MNIKQLTDHRINMMKLIEEFTKEGLCDIVVNIAETMRREIMCGYESIMHVGFERGATRLYSLGLLVYKEDNQPSVFDLISAIDRHEHKDLILDGLYEHMGKPGVYECVKDYFSTGGFLFRLEKCATEAHEQFEEMEVSNTDKEYVFEPEACDKTIVATYQTPGIGTVTITKKDGCVTVEIKQEQDNG